jgi:hypothetical protein
VITYKNVILTTMIYHLLNFINQSLYKNKTQAVSSHLNNNTLRLFLPGRYIYRQIDMLVCNGFLGHTWIHSRTATLPNHEDLTLLTRSAYPAAQSDYPAGSPSHYPAEWLPCRNRCLPCRARSSYPADTSWLPR